MLKPSLQLRVGQQLTMTPQLQQAIRLLQLPSLDLQAHVRETLEINVMLEAEDELALDAPLEPQLEAPAEGAREEAAPVEELRPKPLVTGYDLIAAGYRPGPEFKAMLEAAEDAQLEGRVATTAEGLAVVRERFGEPSGRTTVGE